VASKELTQIDAQRELGLVRRPDPNDVPVEIVRRQRTAAAALCLAVQSSGLEDKEVYGALGIDPGYWTRIKKGEATLQADLVQPFCDAVGNRIYLEWQAFQVGCTLVQIKSEAERQLEAERVRRREAELKVRVLQEAIAGRVVA
jgi:hypothetical protein